MYPIAHSQILTNHAGKLPRGYTSYHRAAEPDTSQKREPVARYMAPITSRVATWPQRGGGKGKGDNFRCRILEDS